MALTRAQAATAIYYQLAALWDAAGMTYTSETVNSITYTEGDMTLPIDRALRAMKYGTTQVSSATATAYLEQQFLDYVEWFALERLVDGLALYTDYDAGDFGVKANQMAKLAQQMYDRKSAYMERTYQISQDARALGSAAITKDDGYHEEADEGEEYTTVIYEIKVG